MKLFTTVVLITIVALTDAAKILVIYPVPSKSHSFLGEGFVRHLTEAGHEVTFITPFPNPKPHKNVTQIDISSLKSKMKVDLLRLDNMVADHKPLDSLLLLFMSNMFMEESLKHSAVEEMMLNTKIEFDAVVAEWFFSSLYSAWGAFYQCPLIFAGTTDVHHQVLVTVDESPNPAYVADVSSLNSPPLSLYQRVLELYSQLKFQIISRLKIEPLENEQYEKYFVKRAALKGVTLPPYDKVKTNASMLLVNSHPSLGIPIRVPANTKYIGGFHIETPVKPLPQDFKNIMDNAKDGVILFSMGSNLKSAYFPTEMKNEFLKVFGEIKETVIWKFEEDLPNKPKNLIITNWMPQQSLLAHPNLKVFITHGGFLSTTESIFHGVPLIGIPVFGDQFVNMNMAVKKGFALKLRLALDLPQQVRVALKEMLGNPEYKRKAKELSMIFHDRPTSPGRELVHWVEHAIRTGGATYLRSPALDVPLYQKMFLDVAAILFTAIFLLYWLIKKALASLCKKKSDKKKKQ